MALVVLAAKRLDFAARGLMGVKCCLFDLKLDMEPFGGIMRPSIGSYRRFDVFNTIAAGRADFAAAISFWGQIMLECHGI